MESEQSTANVGHRRGGTGRYALADSQGRIPFHNGYEDVRVAQKEAQRVGEDHPRESPETVNVVEIRSSEPVTIRTQGADADQGGV